MRPSSIVNFERIVLLSIVLGAVNTVLIWDRLSAAVAASGLGVGMAIAIQVVTIAIYLLLIWFIARKASNVARWIYVVLCAIGLVFGALGLGQAAALYGNLVLVINLVQYVLSLVSIWLLFRADSNAWFRGERPADPDVFS
jgi:hypothetical protein